MSGFHPRDLIKEVKIRPGIYNKDVLDHPQRENKRRLWLEVAERLTPSEEWESYTDVEKDVRVGEISTKWKNLKDHFYREIKLHEAGEASKKRKYVYFDDMEFVRPFVGYKVMSSFNKSVNKTNNDTLDDTTEYVVNEADLDMQALLNCGDNIVEEDVDGTKVTVVEIRPETRRVVKPTYKVLANRPISSAPVANRLNKAPVIKNFDVLKKTGGASSSNFKIRDGDITFCLSLVPTLRKLSDAHKLKAKIEILKILHFYVENIERRNLASQPNVSSNYNKTTTSLDNSHYTDNEDEEEHLDEEHLEEFEEGVIVKREQYNDPLNGSGGSGNTKVWWT